MAIVRFFRFYIDKFDLEEQKTDFVIEDKKIVHKIKNVLRFKVGDKITLFNGDGFYYDFTISDISKNANDLRFSKIGERYESVGKKPKILINLFISVIKKDKLEWILEKGTELGVSSFHPILSERSEKKDFSHERGEMKIIEALEQSGRSVKPTLFEIETLSEVLGQDFSGQKVFLSLNSGQLITEFLIDKNVEEINIFVGPEGGWSEGEDALFKKAGFMAINLGSAILKTETACLVAVSKILI